MVLVKDMADLPAGTNVGGGFELTLLLGDSENTISECTFRLLSLSSNMSFTARYVAARPCIFETICNGR